MTKKLLVVIGMLALIAALALVVVSAVSAQSPTTTPQAPATKEVKGMGRGFGFFGGSVADFDAIAKALNLTPAQLFEQWHSGKTLDQIATAQGVDLKAVQEAANAARLQGLKDGIAQAVKDGKMTQEQADWLLQGLDKGFMKGGFGFGHGMRGGMRGFGGWGLKNPPKAPASGSSAS